MIDIHFLKMVIQKFKMVMQKKVDLFTSENDEILVVIYLWKILKKSQHKKLDSKFIRKCANFQKTSQGFFLFTWLMF